MRRGAQLYEGKAKVVFATPDPGRYVQFFKDDATAFNGLKKGTIAGKGSVNCRMSAALFGLVEGAGVRTHFVELLSDREMLIRAVRIVPLEVVIRNRVAGSLAKRVGRPEGDAIPRGPVIELYYKDDALGDPLLNRSHIEAFGIADATTVDEIEGKARAVNGVLVPFFRSVGLDLVDYKLEFGRTLEGGELLLADEISPDTCRLWDAATGERMDKDRFRRDLGGVEEAYQEVIGRVLGAAGSVAS